MSNYKPYLQKCSKYTKHWKPDDQLINNHGWQCPGLTEIWWNMGAKGASSNAGLEFNLNQLLMVIGSIVILVLLFLVVCHITSGRIWSVTYKMRGNVSCVNIDVLQLILVAFAFVTLLIIMSWMCKYFSGVCWNGYNRELNVNFTALSMVGSAVILLNFCW